MKKKIERIDCERRKFDANAYLFSIERRLSVVLMGSANGHLVSAGGFDPRAPETWPVAMELTEVAQVLRYDDPDTVRELTALPLEEGGIRYLAVGTGRNRRKRLISKIELIEFLSRNSVSPTRPEIVRMTRRKRKPEVAAGGLMQRTIHKASRK